MPKKHKNLKRKVFFNASVILAGLKSPTGGSAKILSWCRTQKITGIISEIVIDEVLRNTPKIGLNKTQVKRWVKAIFRRVEITPKAETVKNYQKAVTDVGDAHLLASCFEVKANYLVTLDKKHVLSLQKKIKWVKIVSPAELIETLSTL